MVGVILGLGVGTGGWAHSAPTQQDGKRICVVVPHFKDEYWLSVGYGLIEEARLAGAELWLFESGGYHALQSQISLLEQCVARQADAILLGAVSADDPALLQAVQDTARRVPVVGLVNALRSDHISGAVGVDWTDMGRVIGRYLSRLHPAGQARPVAAALVTGPAQSGWSPLLERGLEQGLRGSSVQIRRIGRADTGLREQLAQVETILRARPEVEILIGSAPAIEGAMGLAANSEAPLPMLVSTYISHSVRRGLQGANVAAVAFDDPVEQGRLGIRVALEAQLGVHSQDLVGPDILLLEAGQADRPPINLSPADLELSLE